ncbi:MAG: o-succinylbenzoate synthase [Acidobacteriota bacterium]
MNFCRHSSDLSLLGPIRIQRAEAWRVSIPMIEPFRISSGEVSRRDVVVVRLSANGVFGWGESAAMPGSFYSAETPDTCEAELVEHLLPWLVGQEFSTMGSLEAALAERVESRFVRVAIETAAWEMLARHAGQSLRQLFGFSCEPVACGLAVGLYDSMQELHAALERLHPRDYQRLKLKIKRGHDLDIVQAVREWYGDIPLFVDANADYTAANLDVFRALDRYGLMMFEQPFAHDDFETSAALQRLVKTPICFDESIETVADVTRAASLDACRIVNIKLQRIGGYLEAFRIAESCMHYQLPVWMGTMPELGIGSAQALVFAGHPACSFPTDVEASSRWYHDDILEPALELKDGFLPCPSGPGLGFEVSIEKLERYSLRRWSL